MEAHVKNGSKHNNQDVPPFYFPERHTSGPDIMFYVKINDQLYPCFVQLKLRQVLGSSDAEKARASVSSHSIQAKMEKEQEEVSKSRNRTPNEVTTGKTRNTPAQPPNIIDYCPTGTYISMVIAYPSDVVNFQVVRPDPEPELKGLRRVSIHIDDNNFGKIFPKEHVNFLDRLKHHKRPATEESVAVPAKRSKIITRSVSSPLAH